MFNFLAEVKKMELHWTLLFPTVSRKTVATFTFYGEYT